MGKRRGGILIKFRNCMKIRIQSQFTLDDAERNIIIQIARRRGRDEDRAQGDYDKSQADPSFGNFPILMPGIQHVKIKDDHTRVREKI
jgi:hypothetical protein